MTASALVIGGKIEGIQAALDIANSGIEVNLVESSHELSIEGESAIFLRPKLLEVYNHPAIRIFTNTDLTTLTGKKGSFKAIADQKARYVNPQACVSCGRCEAHRRGRQSTWTVETSW